MGDLTKDFSLNEFRVSSRFPDLAAEVPLLPIDELKCYLLCTLVLQPVRDRSKEPIEITSGKRSQVLNKAVKGVPSSAHRFRGFDAACDWRFKDQNSERLKSVFLWLYQERRFCYGEMILYLGADHHTAIDIHVTLPGKENGQTLIKWPDGTYGEFTGDNMP